MRGAVLALGLALLAGPAAAQDLPFDIRATSTCVEAAYAPQDQSGCIGASADACMATPEGTSTYGMGGCLDAELTWWDDRLNRLYRDLMARHREDDAADDLPQGAPTRAGTLRDMQRAWIAYRDAACDHERALWGGGTGGGPATLECLMRLTALQAIHLEESLGW